MAAPLISSDPTGSIVIVPEPVLTTPNVKPAPSVADAVRLRVQVPVQVKARPMSPVTTV